MLLGRDTERDAIGVLLDGARSSRSAALVVRGEPGVGKTALLEDTRDRAADMRILTARGVESESELPFAGLHQLLRPVLERMDALPEPQAQALGRALGLAGGDEPEAFLVYSGCLTLLSEVAERRPVLCLVDDAQWLDTASGDALTFVARRLDAEGIVLLFSAREGDARRFEADGVESLVLDGLDPEAADALLTAAAGSAVPAVRELLVAQTRGNALALVELPSALTESQLSGAEALPEALPMTRQMEAVFHARVRGLPPDAQRLLLLAAADDAEDLGLVTRAGAAIGADRYGLDPAEEAGLVTVHGSRITFRHPLVRSAVYGAATSRERRAAHGALAEALAGDEPQADRRAWHLAASALEHDVAVVRALDDAARRAAARGGHVAAARALERAAELSGDPGERTTRLVGAARYLSLAGRDEQALALADRIPEPQGRPHLRADLARVRTQASIRRRGHPEELVPVLKGAAQELVEEDPALAIDLLMLATAAAWQGGDPAGQLEVAALAASVRTEGLGEAPRRIADLMNGFAAMLKGDPQEGVRLLSRVPTWGATASDPVHLMWASFGSLWIGDVAAFERLLERAADLARARGEAGTLADALGNRSVYLTGIAQRHREAAVAASEAIALARELRADNLLLLPWSALAMVAAVTGDDEAAHRYGEDVIEGAAANGLRLRASAAVLALAQLAMVRGRWDEALTRLDAISNPMDPVATIAAPDRIESAVRAGRPEEARRALEAFETWALSTGARASQTRLAACRGLLAEGEEATRHFGEAIRLIDDAWPFDRLRIRLMAGEHLRREGRRVEAREQLRAALEGLEAIGAEPWAERARVELRASGETARRRGPDVAATLTPQEQQIARLVAQGLTNKEVAAQLFLSPRTIDAHLRGVFSKLGITSRRELRGVTLADHAAPVRGDAIPA